MDTSCALDFGSITNGSSKFDDRGPVSGGLSLSNSLFYPLKVMVAILDMNGMPTVGFKSLQDIFSECAVCVTILKGKTSACLIWSLVPRYPYNGNVIVIVNCDKFS